MEYLAASLAEEVDEFISCGVWVILNDLPRDFGETEIHAIFINKKDAQAEMMRLKGVFWDSYKAQYYKMIKLPRKRL
jgi:hypothetical protein